MKKFISLFIILFLINLGIIDAQSLVIKDICELQSDLTARTNPILDKNGKECAVIRVNIPSIKNVEFDKKKVFHQEYNPGEYVLYVQEGTHEIDFNLEGYIKGKIDFTEFDIDVQGKRVYRCTITNNDGKNKGINDIGPIFITSNIEGAVVLIDGYPVGMTPMKLDNISMGEHTLALVKKVDSENLESVIYACPDTIINATPHQKIHVNLIKTDSEMDLEFVQHGGGDSWTETWTRFRTLKENGKVGVVDLEGNILVPCEYDVVMPELQNGCFVVKKDGKEGLYLQGKGLIVPTIYDFTITNQSDTIKEKLVIARKEGKYGIISLSTGEVVLPFKYYEISRDKYNNYDVFKASLNGSDRQIFISDDANEIRPLQLPVFDTISKFNDGLAVAKIKENNQLVIIDLNLNRMIPIEKSYIVTHWSDNVINEGLCCVQNVDRKFGFMDKNGKIQIPCIFDDIIDGFQDGFAIMKLDGQTVFVTNEGEILHENDSIHFEYNSEDLLCQKKILEIEKNDKKGVIRYTGETIVPCEYEKFIYICGDEDYLTDYITAYKDDKCYLYDIKTGKLLFVSPKGIYIDRIKDGFIMVRDEETETYGYANMKGELIANCIYTLPEEVEMMMNHSVVIISEGLAMIILGDRYGFIDNNGKVVVPLIYTGAIPFSNGITHVKKNDGKWIKLIKDQLK